MIYNSLHGSQDFDAVVKPKHFDLDCMFLSCHVRFSERIHTL